MKEGEFVVDALVFLDGKNNAFLSYVPYEQAQEILQEGGLSQTKFVLFKDTEERPIPETLKNGQSEITDILIRLEPNVCFYLN